MVGCAHQVINRKESIFRALCVGVHRRKGHDGRRHTAVIGIDGDHGLRLVVVNAAANVFCPIVRFNVLVANAHSGLKMRGDVCILAIFIGFLQLKDLCCTLIELFFRKQKLFVFIIGQIAENIFEISAGIQRGHVLIHMVPCASGGQHAGLIRKHILPCGLLAGLFRNVRCPVEGDGHRIGQRDDLLAVFIAAGFHHGFDLLVPIRKLRVFHVFVERQKKVVFHDLFRYREQGFAAVQTGTAQHDKYIRALAGHYFRTDALNGTAARRGFCRDDIQFNIRRAAQHTEGLHKFLNGTVAGALIIDCVHIHADAQGVGFPGAAGEQANNH